MQIQAEGAAHIERALVALTNRLPLMRAIGAWLESSTRERFDTNRAPDGSPWKPSLGAQLRGTPTLVQFGRLRDSFTHAADADQVEVGTNVIYAAIHHFGGVIKAKTAKGLRFMMAGAGFVQVQSVTMPARPILGVSVDDEIEVSELVRQFSTGAWS
jgi:phage virion morphogenesis protein